MRRSRQLALGIFIPIMCAAPALRAQVVTHETAELQFGKTLLLIRGTSERQVEILGTDDTEPVVGAFDPDSIHTLLDSAATFATRPAGGSVSSEITYTSGYVFGRYGSSVTMSRLIGGRTPGLYLYVGQRPFSIMVKLSMAQYREVDKALRDAARVAIQLWLDANPAGTAQRPFIASQVDTPATAIPGGPPPDFSICALAASDTGPVRMRMVIDTAGVPSAFDAELVSGPYLCALAVREALDAWRFQPARRAGRPVFQQVIMSFPIHRADSGARR